MKRVSLFTATALALSLFSVAGCHGGPGHFDNDPGYTNEQSRIEELQTDPSPSVNFFAPEGQPAATIARGINSDLVFKAGGNDVIQVDGTPSDLKGNDHMMQQDMAEFLMRNIMEMQIDTRTGAPLYTVTVDSPGARPVVSNNDLMNTMK